MEFRRRHNTYFAQLGAAGSRDPVGVIMGHEIQVERWLGVCDRAVLSGLADMEPVLLDIQAWRVTLLDRYHWLPAGRYMVGARVPGGVVGVMDGMKPLLKEKHREADRLGRAQQCKPVEVEPWYMRRL